MYYNIHIVCKIERRFTATTYIYCGHLHEQSGNSPPKIYYDN